MAEHAHESNAFMTVPLVLLSILAVAVGWLGISDEFLGTEGLFTNHFHHYVGATQFELFHELHNLDLIAHEIEGLPWSWWPLIISLVVALGGLFVGWLIYACRPLKEGQTDPLVAPLGPIHTFLNHKWYWDELHTTVYLYSRPLVLGALLRGGGQGHY
ncbi:MAG: hypothetical protein R3C44_01165 [Chloroflexota bacterium]